MRRIKEWQVAVGRVRTFAALVTFALTIAYFGCTNASAVGGQVTRDTSGPAAPEGQPVKNGGQREPAPVWKITSSTTVPRKAHYLPVAGDGHAVEIVGDDIVVDFQGSEIRGAKDGTAPDTLTGRGIVVRGRNVTIRGAIVSGYKIGIYARDAAGIKIENCDVSQNYRQRLKSTRSAEDLSDWLYGHENDADEWLRYGAGIYLHRCPKAEIRNCRARNGQNGACLVLCDDALVVDNDMSFMSGWGLAMWRSNRCDIMNNKFDFCIRGYSHGMYSRGQDSAGILVYEQCSDNVFAFNSATHSGDGFFLYAGNETLKKTGEGGCNNNLVYGNDFSHAAANGIEATFSTGNRFIENIMMDCEHGIWAGYSYNSLFAGNKISQCKNGISIEHGQENRMVANKMANCVYGIDLWWDDDEDLLNTPFAEKRLGCPSEYNEILANDFNECHTGIRLRRDANSRIAENGLWRATIPLLISGDSIGVTVDMPKELITRSTFAPDAAVLFNADSAGGIEALGAPTSSERERINKRKGSQDAFLAENIARGRSQILMDEWGPYDFTDVRVEPQHATGGASVYHQVLAPVGKKFRVTSVRGPVDVSPRTGVTPARILVKAKKDGFQSASFDVQVEGETYTAHSQLLRADWKVDYFSWSSPQDDPRKEGAWERITAQAPILSDQVASLDFVWQQGGPVKNIGNHFATVATTSIDVPAGTWRFKTISDDGVRVFVDGKMVLENWTHHGPTTDTAEVALAAGAHEIRVEHFEIDGFAQLVFAMEPSRR
ncbi:MAG: right-handed parallel beta-helix repeat-containing protein [Planctomycetota bacterium]|jgi:parallel beta-helix repeat protein